MKSLFLVAAELEAFLIERGWHACAGHHEAQPLPAVWQVACRDHQISLTISLKSLGASTGGLLNGPWRSLW